VNAATWISPTNLLGQAMPIVGGLVRTGENSHPQFHIIAIAADRAWIRDIQHGTDHVVPVDLCRKIGDS